MDDGWTDDGWLDGWVFGWMMGGCLDVWVDGWVDDGGVTNDLYVNKASPTSLSRSSAVRMRH